jgi:hypothetical protein
MTSEPLFERFKKMKLTPRMLRGLIKEAIHDHETVGLQDDESLDMFIQETVANYDSLYDENDPSTSSLGRTEWSSQCELAGDRLREKIEDLVNEIESELFDGRFYRGR